MLIIIVAQENVNKANVMMKP